MPAATQICVSAVCVRDIGSADGEEDAGCGNGCTPTPPPSPKPIREGKKKKKRKVKTKGLPHAPSATQYHVS